jgi:hypothetical protein
MSSGAGRFLSSRREDAVPVSDRFSRSVKIGKLQRTYVVEPVEDPVRIVPPDGAEKTPRETPTASTAARA